MGPARSRLGLIPVPSNCNVAVTSAVASVESAKDCGFTAAGNLQDTDPLLGPLTDLGGDSDVLAPGAGSRALDFVPLSSCAADDQRGVLRPQGSLCDAGAYEFAPTRRRRLMAMAMACRTRSTTV